MDNKLLAEVLHMKELMTEVAPTGVLSMVADSYDFWSVVSIGLPLLKNTIMARDGTLVIRPDSGDPVKIVCGYKLFSKFKFETLNDALGHASAFPQDTYDYEVYELEDGRFVDIERGCYVEKHEVKGLIECLWDIFGGTTDTEGYRTLDSHIGAIYGDSITLARSAEFIERLEAKMFIPTCVQGIGSFSYQYVTRDTHGFAMKSTAIKFEWNREWTPIWKEPATDSGKNSAKGLMMVKSFNDNTMYQLVENVSADMEARGALDIIFEDSVLFKETTLTEIRNNIKNINRSLAIK